MGDNADMQVQGVNVCCARSTPPGFNANGTESLFYFVHSQPPILNFFRAEICQTPELPGEIREFLNKKKL